MPGSSISQSQRDPESDGIPLVSIVVNNYNYAPFLRQSIESALAQEYSRTEVVVVDDASTDGSPDIIRSFGNRIVAVLQDRNGGQAAALNAGFSASKGALVIFLDSDDYLYPTAVARAVSARKAGTAIIQYRLHLVDSDGRVLDLHPAKEIAFDSGNVVSKLLRTGRYEGNVTSGNAFTRSALSEILPIPTKQFRIGADGYLVTVAPFYGDVVSIDEPLGAYRRHGTNLWMCRTGTFADRCRRAIAHDADKHYVLAQRAGLCGFDATSEPGLRDWQHLQVRIGSLILEPKKHPVVTDTRVHLSLAGASAALRAPLPWKRKAIVATWFLSLGALPAQVAKHPFVWLFEPSAAPQIVKRVLKTLRRVTS